MLFSYRKSKCINGCELFNDEKNYSYWEGKKETQDEIEILSFLNTRKYSASLGKILHIGIGNSFIAKNLNNFSKIDGISISYKEILNAQESNINGYNSYFLNKYNKDAFNKFSSEYYDLIIDTNLKSFCCCEPAFDHLLAQYTSLLNSNGTIVTNLRGMNWSKIVIPKVGFNLKNLIHLRLKEIDGPESNKISVSNIIKKLKKTGRNFEISQNENVVFIQKHQ